ncbi:DNA methyltransferase [Allomuricauda taeanensis]|uniref:DNA methyltransferase n=1 Tax=Flagellimonas taeanensis TaxID=1005926 RepID=UPI002E7B4104|nr:DNA methyltransferase [Allomuricauda taeanensis]MEE1962017.1 DNA methyltransferase [Allomuricauda taeanensis]
MNTTEIQHNVQNLIDNFSKENFVFDLLVAYGISKTSVTRLKKGDYNLSKVDGEILYKKKIFFKVEATGKLLSSIDSISKEERILKHKPRFVILTDHKQIVAKDLLKGKNLDVTIKELPNYFDFFLPLAGSEVYNASNDNEADRNASYKMASLYDVLIEGNPTIYNSKESIHHLNIFLSRLLFCFFAEDTEIFKEESIFTDTLAQHTAENGSDTHSFLNDLFDRLNTEDVKHLPDYLKKFEYVNGGLFGQKINSPKFTSKARKMLIELGELQWKDINPDIFGSMIQAVVDKDYRSDLGMHYTSVENIKKLIKPLFLDEMYEEFENASTAKQLQKLIKRISKIKFFDPACGSGNFLIITYKEIRLLEIKILQKITDLEATPTFKWTSVQLSQFYGIEIDDFAHEMAILSLWLAEHQMNRVFEEMLFDYGKSKPILPLKEAGQIQQGNATRRNWNEVCPISGKDEVYVIGNPPYLGSRNQDKDQKDDLKFVFSKDYKSLDYIAAWFYKGANYIKGMNGKCAFVSTNSVCQGDQVALTWSRILSDKIEIDFAYQSFKWVNNAKGNAGVTVIILGLRNVSNQPKYLFRDKFKQEVKNINPYLVDAPNIVVKGVSNPLSKFPEMRYGNMPNDGGNLILSEEEKNEILKNSYVKNYWIKEFIGSSEFIRGKQRFCLFIDDEDLDEATKVFEIKNRLDKVEIHRLNSTEVSTRDKAKTPNHFYFSSHLDTDSILIPRHSSENRYYIPIGIFTSETIIADSAMAVYNAEPWLFAVITSRMHMVWVRNVGGKLKTDYRYSAKLCYNTFPFPDISSKQKENLNQYVFDILDERAKHPSKTMAQLYNPTTMPKGLLQAHQALDTAIEQCYRLQPFHNDTERLEYLFKQYEEMLKKDSLFAKEKKTRKSTSKR